MCLLFPKTSVIFWRLKYDYTSKRRSLWKELWMEGGAEVMEKALNPAPEGVDSISKCQCTCSVQGAG